VDESAVSGHTRARVGESSPIPDRALAILEGGFEGAEHYLDTVDNVSPWLKNTCADGKGYFVRAQCPDGHSFAMELVCAKEWCSVCGEDRSHAHNRRFVRWYPKIQQFESMGYWVFTLPLDIREQYRGKVFKGYKDKAITEDGIVKVVKVPVYELKLVKLGHQVQEILKYYGFERGLRRWHWFGSKSNKWNPHLNVIVDGKYLSPVKIEAIKQAYRQLLGVETINAKYKYRSTPGEMVHTLRYVTRATFKDYAWDETMAMRIRGFRNMVVWGRNKWDNAPVWTDQDIDSANKVELEDLDIEAITKLAEGNCPVCGKHLAVDHYNNKGDPVYWSEALPIALLKMVDNVSLGAGFYRLSDVRGSPGIPEDAKFRLETMENLHRAMLRSAEANVKQQAVEAEAEQLSMWQALLSEDTGRVAGVYPESLGGDEW